MAKTAIIELLLASASDESLRQLLAVISPPEASKSELVAVWLREARCTLNKTQAEIGRLAGVDGKVISCLERQDEISISGAKLTLLIERIAEALKDDQLKRTA